jgi:hypothetical protein
VQIVVKLRAAAKDTAISADEVSRELELQLEPSNPSGGEFTAEVPEDQIAEVLERLWSSPAVEAAYPKPAAELP